MNHYVSSPIWKKGWKQFRWTDDLNVQILALRKCQQGVALNADWCQNLRVWSSEKLINTFACIRANMLSFTTLVLSIIWWFGLYSGDISGTKHRHSRWVAKSGSRILVEAGIGVQEVWAFVGLKMMHRQRRPKFEAGLGCVFWGVFRPGMSL